MAARLTKYLAAHKFLSDYQSKEESDSNITEANDNRPTSNEARILVSKSESYKNQRARINQRLRSMRTNGGTEYMQNKIAIRMPMARLLRNEPHTNHSLNFLIKWDMNVLPILVSHSANIQLSPKTLSTAATSKPMPAGMC